MVTVLTVHGCCPVSYHASDEGQGTGGLLASEEVVTLGKIPADGHIGGDVLSGVDAEVGGADSVHGGLKMMRGIVNTEEMILKKQNVVNVLSALKESP